MPTLALSQHPEPSPQPIHHLMIGTHISCPPQQTTFVEPHLTCSHAGRSHVRHGPDGWRFNRASTSWLRGRATKADELLNRFKCSATGITASGKRLRSNGYGERLQCEDFFFGFLKQSHLDPRDLTKLTAQTHSRIRSNNRVPVRRPWSLIRW